MAAQHIAHHEIAGRAGRWIHRLEVAATARALGKMARMLESAPRLMLRSVSPELAEHMLWIHRESGMDMRTGISVRAFTVEGGRLTSLNAGGQRLPIDNLLPGVGAIPEHAVAGAPGLIPPPEVADRYRRPGLTEGSFSILHYANGSLRCVESINAPMDHMAARKLLDAGINPAAEATCDPAVPLKQLVG